MQLKILNIPWVDGIGFDDSELVEFCNKEDVVDVGHNFFNHENKPCLTMLVQYRDDSRPATNTRKAKKDPRAGLKPEDQKLYDILKEWRSTRCTADGIPPYLIFDNKQIAEIARLKPETKKALGAIEKVGKGKLDKYAEDVFAILKNQCRSNNGK
jgi:ATP-dependent DNA helicase RecQ